MAVEQRHFDSNYNYQKVATSGSQTTSVAVTGGGPPPTPATVTIPHTLGKITSFRAWYDPNTGRRIPVTGNLTTSIASNSITMDAYMTTTSLVFSILNFGAGAVNVTFYWRIYYDD